MSDENELNIVKQTCQILNISQKELANKLDVKPSAVSNWVNGDIPKMVQLALELILENKELKDDFDILKKAHKILSK